MRLVTLVLTAAILAGCAAPNEGPAPQPSAPTSGGPAWSFTALDGATYSRDSPERNATVLFFMASWCSTCRSKAPILADVNADYAAKGVQMLSLDFDPSESEVDIRGWKERYQQDWPHGIDEGLRIQRAFEVRAQSSVVVLDAAGNVVESWGYGGVTEEGLRAALERALAA